jgi:hypothetical protein
MTHLMDAAIIYYIFYMAGVGVHSDVCCKALFLPIYYKNYFCSRK